MRYGWMLATCLGWAMAVPTGVDAEPVKVTIDGARRAAPVTKYEYGMFIEPIGGLVARTLWAEMLDDRKFYYPVVPAALDAPPPLNAEGRPGVSYRKWRPIGGDDAVIMDSKAAYVGVQSPRVALDGTIRKGFSQSGIGLAKGKRYDGYVLLSGDASAQVEVALVWGPGTDDRQTIALPSPGADWKRAAFSFTPAADAADARLEITGLGSGSFRVGAVSLMPSDNVRGWRADSTAIARSLNSGMWRLPGGNFLSNWDWHGALGPRDKRAPMFDHAWSAMQPNDIGMDEWMDLTKILGVEPYVTVDAGLGDANSAAEEVEYLNGPATSVWGARRAANGHPEPYGVKFWNIGNEPYGWWQIGKTSLDYFMIKHNAFAAAMRAVDPTITLIGSGAMPDQLHPREAQENASLESIAPKFGTEQDWTGGLLAKAWGNFDGISEHWYDRPEKRPNAPADALQPGADEGRGMEDLRAALPGHEGQEGLPVDRRVRLFRRGQSEVGPGLRSGPAGDVAPHRLPDHGGVHDRRLDHGHHLDRRDAQFDRGGIQVLWRALRRRRRPDRHLGKRAAARAKISGRL